MALYEVVIDQRYFGQQCINRFNYTTTGIPASVLGSFALLSGMGFVPDAGTFPADTVFSAIRGVQNGSLSYAEIVIKNVYDVVDFYTLPYTTPPVGLNNQGEPDSPIVALGIRSNRVVANIKRGMKRFVGACEGDIANGGNLAPSILGQLVALCTKLSQPVTYDDEGNVITFTQVIVSKLKYVPDPAKPTKFAYKYYPTLAEQEQHLATGVTWQPYNNVRSQTSRQYGRGT